MTRTLTALSTDQRCNTIRAICDPASAQCSIDSVDSVDSVLQALAPRGFRKPAGSTHM